MSVASDLTNKIINFIYENQGYAWRSSSVGIYDQKTAAYRTAPKKGVADILACWQGRLIAIEVKIGSDSLSAEQTGFLKNIDHVQGLTYVAKDFPSFVGWWDERVVVE